MTTRREFISGASNGLLALGAIPALGRRVTGTGLMYDARYLDHVLPLRRGEVHPERPLRLVRMMDSLRVVTYGFRDSSLAQEPGFVVR